MILDFWSLNDSAPNHSKQSENAEVGGLSSEPSPSINHRHENSPQPVDPDRPPCPIDRIAEPFGKRATNQVFPPRGEPWMNLENLLGKPPGRRHISTTDGDYRPNDHGEWFGTIRNGFDISLRCLDIIRCKRGVRRME